MAVTTASRPNHYEILGVSPTAAGDEIARAFAREGSVFRPHAFGVLTELCIAYETLRDPIKRRAYDASLGLERKPAPQNRSIGAREILPEQIAPPTTAPPKVAIPLQSDRPGTSQTASPEAKPAHPKPITGPERGRVGDDNPHLALAATLGMAALPLDLRRPAIVAGSIVAAACALGGLIGYWSGRDVGEAAQVAKPVSISLPALRHEATSVGPAANAPPAPSQLEARPAPARRVASVAAPVEPKALDPEPAAIEEPALQGPASLGPIEQAAGEVGASPLPARLPLSNRMIARTIERIGYACGSVSSAVPVEGEPQGIFKITCSSGQSYKAGPVNGRYRFRRWDKS